MSEDYEARAHKQLQIESWSNAARTLLIRGATDGGPFAEQHTTNADRSRATDTFELHGRPTKLQISPSTAPVRRGECYVRATLLLDGEPVQRLSSGYLTDSKTLSGPPGVFESFTEGSGLRHLVTGTNPAAGAEISEAVPTNARWKIRGIFIQLTTDVTVIDRRVAVTFDDGANMYYLKASGGVHPASLTKNYHPTPGYNIDDAAFDAQGSIRIPLPPDVILSAGYRIRSVTANLQAGDNFGAPLLDVEEWIEE